MWNDKVLIVCIAEMELPPFKMAKHNENLLQIHPFFRNNEITLSQSHNS